MEIQVRNVVGIERADITVDKLSLVAGLNGAGKTSLAAALAAVLTNTPGVRGVDKKKDFGQLVRVGAETASVALRAAAGEASMEWPKGQFFAKGNAESVASSPIAAGLVRITQLGEEQRSAYLIGLLKVRFEQKDLEEALADLKVKPETIAKVWQLVEREGWDGAQTHVHDQGVKLKGQWEQLAFTRWGAKKAEAWLPEGFDPELAKLPAGELQGRVAAAQAAVDKARVSQAVDEHRRAADEALAGGLTSAVSELTNLDDKLRIAQTRCDNLVKERDALPPPYSTSDFYNQADPTAPGIDPHHAYICAHCQKLNVKEQVVDSAGKPNGFRMKAVEELSKAELDERRKNWASADGRVSNARDEVSRLHTERTDAQCAVDEATAARKRLDAATQGGAAPGVEAKLTLDQAQADLAAAQKALTTTETGTKARQLAKAIEINLAILDKLKPDGVRRTVLGKKLKAFSEGTLKTLSESWGIAPVSIEPDLAVYLGKRPYGLLSESEQFRVDVVLQVAAASEDHSALIVIDRADMLDGPARGGLCRMLLKYAGPTIILMTLSKPDQMPPLEKGGGRTYWIEGNRAVAGAEARAAA